MLVLETVRQRFGDAFSFVITGAGTYRVDVTPASPES